MAAITTTSSPEGSDNGLDLDEWDRLMIVLAVALFLLLTFVLTVCVLSPLCCLHDYCCCQYPDELDKKSLNSYGPEVYGSMDEFNGGLKVDGKHSKLKQGHKWYPMATLRESEISDWSDISAPEIIEMGQTDPRGRTRSSSRTSDYSSSTNSVLNPAHPDSRLAYAVTSDPQGHALHIKVIQLANFRVTEPDGAEAPYVKVRVYSIPKGLFGFKKTGREALHQRQVCEVQTKIQRRTDSPVYNESFEVKAVDLDTSAYVIRLLVCDLDRFSRHVVVGEVTRELTRAEQTSEEEIVYNDLIATPQDENLGEIHLAMMYLPTAEKLNLTVLNCRGLRQGEGGKKTNRETFVKITMVYEGRQLKKHKTSGRRGHDAMPVFGDTFVFDVPAYQLDNVHFSICVIGVDKDKEDGSSLLGRLYVGVNFDPEVKAQWMEMVQHARKQVACWHKLQA